jgi:putative nucleotidyltransferase with HDIG domain
MRFFKPIAPTERVPLPATAKPPLVDGWSERELASVYSVAPVRHLKPRESLFTDLKGTESFFVLIEGSIQVVVKWDDHAGRPGVFRRGDCVAPLPKSSGLQYSAEAVETCTLIELTPTVMKHLPEGTQLSVYKVAVAATSRINAYIRAVNGEVVSKNALLASYVELQNKRNAEALKSDFVREFLVNIPRMPAYGTDLLVKLMDDRCSIQEIVDGIKTDPSVAAILLSSVNSARFSFHKKIESFYHACMILGLNNIYTLILHEAVRSAMPRTRSTKQIQRHSVLITTLCNEVATAAKDTHAQAAATIGLLHDVGKGIQEVMRQQHPDKSGLIDSLQSAGLGAELLRSWGIPERICQVIEFQQKAEFTAPDLIPDEYRREAGILHVAHVLEGLLLNVTVAPECRIYTRDYMAILGLPDPTPEGFLKGTLLPGLIRNRHRLPQQILDVLPADDLASFQSDQS